MVKEKYESDFWDEGTRFRSTHGANREHLRYTRHIWRIQYYETIGCDAYMLH